MSARPARRKPAKFAVPRDVPEVSATPAKPEPKPEADPIPEDIRKMLEAAYT